MNIPNTTLNILGVGSLTFDKDQSELLRKYQGNKDVFQNIPEDFLSLLKEYGLKIKAAYAFSAIKIVKLNDESFIGFIDSLDLTEGPYNVFPNTAEYHEYSDDHSIAVFTFGDWEIKYRKENDFALISDEIIYEAYADDVERALMDFIQVFGQSDKDEEETADVGCEVTLDLLANEINGSDKLEGFVCGRANGCDSFFYETPDIGFLLRTHNNGTVDSPISTPISPAVTQLIVSSFPMHDLFVNKLGFSEYFVLGNRTAMMLRYESDKTKQVIEVSVHEGQFDGLFTLLFSKHFVIHSASLTQDRYEERVVRHESLIRTTSPMTNDANELNKRQQSFLSKAALRFSKLDGNTPVKQKFLLLGNLFSESGIIGTVGSSKLMVEVIDKYLPDSGILNQTIFDFIENGGILIDPANFSKHMPPMKEPGQINSMVLVESIMNEFDDKDKIDPTAWEIRHAVVLSIISEDLSKITDKMQQHFAHS